MQLSIRNQLAGTVESVATGEAMSTVRVRLDGGQEVTAAITAESARDLALTEGTAVLALVKSTEVAVAAATVPRISIRNQLAGTITAVEHGAVMTTVKLAVAGGVTVTAAITKDAAEDLDLAEGAPAVALIKSTEVSVALP
ncbi:molybdopterin-binding protein [Dactylosporangium siamense]|uniref:Molybdenum-binding protein n=1 Tax=Dactylosporangium siamense TaxID=685454 RepID=A0A919PKT0_9ACTN|nr:TOBE domain-containing protein [Dactylosporangium siamense]GIG45362.1 molybdenum-binding protein [Dactylosporangium siamense]